MALELEGRIVRRLGIQRGKSARGNWAKQEFILEFQDGNYPAQACLSVWGEDKVKDLERFRDDEPVRVSFHVNSREYNGRWYTDLRAWRIESVPQNAGPDNGGPARDWDKAPAPKAPTPTANDFQGSLNDEDDDLPF